MKKLQKVIFFLGAISLVVFGNKEALSTITTSQTEEETPQVEVITSTPETTNTSVTPDASTSTDSVVPATTKKKVATPVKPPTPSKPVAPSTPSTPAVVEKPKEEVKTTIEEPVKKEKATSSK
mgnify:FL=1